jgi:predicted ATPase
VEAVLQGLVVRGFRSLLDVEVTFAPLTVLVGPNGAGKSNLLSVVRFLGDVARTDLGPAIADHGGWDRLIFHGKAGRRIEIQALMRVTRHSSNTAQDVYTLELSKTRNGIHREESFSFKRTRGAGRRITIRGSKVEVEGGGRLSSLREESAGLSTLPRLEMREGGEQVSQVADLFRTFRVFDIDVAAARLPSRLLRAPPKGPVQLLADASNLAAFLRYLADEHAASFKQLQEDLRYILPGFTRLEVAPVGGPAADAYAVSVHEAAFPVPTPLADASFGTVRALALLALLHDPHPPKLTCVEEIDHGLHPDAIDRIVSRLRSASRRSQILVATHSPTFVNRLEPRELLVCERDTETGASRIPAISAEEVAAMEGQSGLGLGELWFSGALGGTLE